MQTHAIVLATENFVRQELGETEPTGHDFWHAKRVHKMALHIANQVTELKENDKFVIELTALLHDIADWKFHDGNMTIGPQKARIWLETQYVDQEVINSVCEIIKGISFKGGNVPDVSLNLAGQIVQDADRLDAMGPIGIARAFAYGGYKKHPLHNHLIKPVLHSSIEEYKNRQSSTINHFYEKLLLLKDRMNTDIARKIAIKKHQYLVDFLAQFHEDWGGNE